MVTKVRYYSCCLFLLLTIIVLFSNHLLAQAIKTYTATKIPSFWNVPVIDGKFNEPIWSYSDKDSLLFGGDPENWSVPWQNFSDNLITWKAAWSDQTNRLYIAVEIRDDIQGIYDNHDPDLPSFLPFNDECLELFVDGNNSGGNYENNYDLAQQWLVTGENKIVLDDYPVAGEEFRIFTGNDLITAVSWDSGGNWYFEAEIKICNMFPTIEKSLAQGDTIGWNIWYDDSDNETLGDSTYDRDHQVGWLYSGPANSDADHFGDLIFGDVPNLPPNNPTLITPINNAFLSGARPLLTWNVPADLNGDSLHFKVEIAYDSSFSNQIYGSPFESQIDGSGFNPIPPLLEGSGTCSFTPQSNLPDGAYWWRITARDSLAFGIASNSRKFIIDTIEPVIHQIKLQNPNFGTNWFNPIKNPRIPLEIEYSEINAQACTLNVDWLQIPLVKDNILTGNNQKTSFNISISHILDDNYRLGVTISDKAGNTKSDSTTINIDSTLPRGTRASSPVISYDSSFMVRWCGGTDGYGSGLTGKYDINLKIDNGPWQNWLTNFEGDSCQFDKGVTGQRYYFEALAWDNVGNREDSTSIAESVTLVKITSIDTTAPPPPLALKANGSNPSPWQQSNEFYITWQNPVDSSGIARSWYKIGSTPTSNSDTHGSTPASPPFIAIATQQFGQPLYFWLEDSSRNVNYLNRDSVILRYDVVPPTGTVTISPDTSTDSTFMVSWQGGNDAIGSGLSGFYDVKYKKDDGIWGLWKNKFFGTSDHFTGENGHIYSFEALAWDIAGNREDSTEIAESTTFVYVDAEPPPPPINPLANGSNPSPMQKSNQFNISWENPYDPSGIIRCFFKLGLEPVNNNDVTGTASASPPELKINATQESGQLLYLWLEDGRENKDYKNHSSIELRYDATAPRVKITYPVPFDTLSVQFDIRANIVDESIASFELAYRLETQDIWQILLQDSLDSSILDSMICHWENSTDNGNLYLKLTAWDKHGNSASDTVKFFLDNRTYQTLNAKILYPPNISNLRDTVRIIGNATGEKFSTYSLVLKSPTLYTSLVENNLIKENALLYIFDTKLFPDGEYKLLLTVFSVTGTQKSDSIKIKIRNHQYDPIAVISDPLNHAFLHDSVSVKGIATGINFKEYAVFLIGKNTNKVLGGGAGKISNDTLITFNSQDFLDGDYTLSLTVLNIDSSNDVDDILIVIDNTPPQAEIIKPVKDTINCFISIEAEATDKNLDYVSLKYAEILEADPFKFHPIAESCSTSWDTRSLNGYYTLKLTATDKGGLQSKDDRVYYIDNPVFDPKNGLNKNYKEFSLYIPPNGYEPAVICIEPKKIEDFGFDPMNIKPTELVCQIHSTIAKENFDKPANFKIDYGNISKYDEDKLAIFQWINDAWQFLGGTIDRDKRVISTAIEQIGVYGLFDIFEIENAISKDFKLVCQPRVFSPRGGGYSTETNLTFCLEKDSNVTIKIFNLAGRLVKNICENIVMKVGTNSIPWNGLDNEDRYCVSGLYVVLLQTDEKQATQTVMVLNK